MLTFYATSLFISRLRSSGSIARFMAVSVGKLQVPQGGHFIVRCTASSEQRCLVVMLKLSEISARKIGVDSSFRTGYSVNLDARRIYLTLASIFIAQATNTPWISRISLRFGPYGGSPSKELPVVTGSGFHRASATFVCGRTIRSPALFPHSWYRPLHVRSAGLDQFHGEFFCGYTGGSPVDAGVWPRKG